MKHIVIFLCAICLSFTFAAPSAGNDSPSDISVVEPVGALTEFKFKDWGGPKIPVYLFTPEGVDLSKAPILMMMHGNSRSAKGYLKSWAPLAQEKGVIVVAPLFNKEKFPGSRGYNLGNIYNKKGKFNKESKWSFSAIEPLFDHVVEMFGGDQKSYTLYGHSAGSQFVHRYLYFKPDARVKRYLLANAGWYTLPTVDDFPYGLRATGVSVAALKAALSKDVVILLGDEDTDKDHKSLRRTPEAMEQGPHRFARGFYFEKIGKAQAKTMGAAFGWRSVVVPGVAHSNGGMAKKAIDYVE